jgi:hypothetical protein
MEARTIGFILILVGILTANPHRLFEQLASIYLELLHLLIIPLR